MLTAHRIFEPIKTSVPEDELMAGSALRDLNGGVVGLVVRTNNPSVTAVPIDQALRAASTLAETGRPPAAWLGLNGRATPSGVLITEVADRSPAAGLLEAGDVVATIDGRRVSDLDHLAYLLQLTEAPTITLGVVRDARTVGVEVSRPGGG